MSNDKIFLRSCKKQKGSAIIIAIFVVILVGLLGSSLVKLNEDELELSLYEIYASRANFAVYSANELVIMQLKASNFSDCNSTNFTPSIISETEDFPNCIVEFKCEKQEINDSHLYQITTKATCGNSEVFASQEKVKKIRRANYTNAHNKPY